MALTPATSSMYYRADRYLHDSELRKTLPRHLRKVFPIWPQIGSSFGWKAGILTLTDLERRAADNNINATAGTWWI